MFQSALFQLVLVKLRGFLREPEAVFWIFVFPLLLALALGVAFRAKAPDVLPIGVERGPGADWIVQAISATPGLEARPIDGDQAAADLRAGRIALVVVAGEPWVYWYDPSRPDARLAALAVDDALQRAAGRGDVHAISTREMTDKGSRYIDFLIPGLLGMNLMGTGMWGIGFYLVQARAGRLLRRFVATPMRRSDFLLAQILGRLLFLFIEVGVLVVFARVVFDVPLRGSIFAFVVASLLGAVTFAGLGLLVASRSRTIEGVAGLMNFVMMPMWIGSGTFFSVSRFPEAVQPVLQALPLTAVNDALRAVMLEGASLAQISGELGIAGVWAIVSFALALKLFRWT